jgi:hypothetical protein
MDSMRLMKSLVILAIIIVFPGFVAARDYHAAEFSSNENVPEYPELKISMEPDADLFTIRNVGAPIYNATVEVQAIVYLYGNDCMLDGFASTRPICYAYEPWTDRTFFGDDPRTISFSTRFGIDFEHVKAWFARLKDAVGSINDHCLNSVAMQYLIKVNYDRETGMQSSRYFLAAITYRDYIDSTNHHKVSHTSEIETDYLNPDQWSEKINQVRLAGHIRSWDVSDENIEQAKKYLSKMSGGSTPLAPPMNLRIIRN